MAFIIINKAKGWWVVQKDPEGAGNVVTDSLKSGWVPAGESDHVVVESRTLPEGSHFSSRLSSGSIATCGSGRTAICQRRQTATCQSAYPAKLDCFELVPRNSLDGLRAQGGG